MEKYPKLINQSDNSVITINAPTFCIGRSLTCDHIIQSLDVSRFHCIIKKNNNKWILSDRSTNGTIVNSKLCTFNKSIHLKDGDIIKLGASNVTFKFKSIPENQQLENNDGTMNKKASTSCSTMPTFPDDDGFLEEAASLLAERIEEAQNNEESAAIDDRSENDTDNCAQIKEDKDTCSKEEQVAYRKDDIEESSSSSNVPQTKATSDDLLQNKRDDDESRKKLDIVDDELTCSICSELFIKAVTLNCSHTFCKFCIERWKKNQSKCPICRKQITNVSPTLVLDNFIEKIVNTQNEEVKEARGQLMKQREEATVNAASSSHTTTTEGDVVDVDDYSDYEDNSDMTYSSDDGDYDEYPDYSSHGRRPYYGGYGTCFICNQPGHWANHCPFK